jgi:hypothetical protein
MLQKAAEDTRVNLPDLKAGVQMDSRVSHFDSLFTMYEKCSLGESAPHKAGWL